jgi:hypothetical protein
MEEDKERFVAGLEEGLKAQMLRALEEPSPDFSELNVLVKKYRWESVYTRVEEVYRAVLDKDTRNFF